MESGFDAWMSQVRMTLESINMALESWQKAWPFDFDHEFKTGTRPKDAAMKANMFWWKQQNAAIGQECRKTPNCWLPKEHQGKCQPV